MTLWQAQAVPFQVFIEGPNSVIETHQRQAELAMARNVDFCRGYTMPGKMSGWKCRRVGGGESKCEAQYDCRLIKRNFSRVTETRRLLRILENLPRNTIPLKMSFSRKPLLSSSALSSKKVVAKAPVPVPSMEKETRERETTMRTRPTQRRRRRPEVRPTQDSAQNIADLEEVFDGEEVDEQDEEDLEDEEDEDDEDDEEERVERVSATRGGAKLSYGWRALEVAGVQIVNNEETQSMTFDFAWTPWIGLGQRWRLEGRLGGHYLSLIEEVDGEEEEEVFLTYHTLARIRFRLWGALHVWAGLGTQSWSSEEGGSFSMKSVGASWHFESPRLKFIDKLFVSQDWTDDDGEHVAIKAGVGLSF